MQEQLQEEELCDGEEMHEQQDETKRSKKGKHQNAGGAARASDIT